MTITFFVVMDKVRNRVRDETSLLLYIRVRNRVRVRVKVRVRVRVRVIYTFAIIRMLYEPSPDLYSYP